MLVFHPGLQCPICRTYVRELDRESEDFATRVGNVIAIGTDDRGGASETLVTRYMEDR